MSHTGGRGLGRAGRGKVGKVSSSEEASSRPSSSSAATGRGASQAPVAKTSISHTQIGESRTGFPQLSSEAGGDAGKATALKAGERAATAVGRGGVRGRREIAVVDVVKTKPETCVTKKGDAGVKLLLTTNYFKLDTMTNWVLFQYRVDFSVQEDREVVLRAWLRQHKDRLKAAYIFDGTMLFTSQRLTPEKEPLTLVSTREDDTPVTITIKLVQELRHGNAVYLQVFNILVRRCLLHLQLHLVNRNYFDPKASIQLPQHGLEIWPGYITSIRQHESNVLMCADISHKVMRTDTALKLLSECTKESGDYRRLFQQCVIGATVLTDYNNKTYRVDDVDFSLTPMSTFKYRNNEDITYVQYYKQRYQINITDLRQPLLVSRASARDVRAGKERQCLLVPELCRMTGLTSRMRDNRTLMKDMADITKIGPEDRIARLKVFNERLQGEKQIAEDFQQWGLTLNKELVTLSGRELPQEKLIGGNQMTYSSGPDVDWTRYMKSTGMLYCAKFETFVVICPYRLKRELEEFLGALRTAGDGLSFRIPKPIILDSKTDSPKDMIETTEMAISKYYPDIIMHCFTSERVDRYNAVKKKCYVDRGIPSQVVLARSMKAKNVMSIAAKVAIQINCKLGGAPWSVHIPSDNVMVLGFDVCHDPGSKSNSVGALVGSLNRAMSAWFSTVNRHSSGAELSDTLAMEVCKAIKMYQKCNNTLPTRIFIYRDGVGEGQLHHVYKHEVEFVKKRLTEIYGGETWKMAYIVVSKRIRTRFFQNGGNPRPGTVVDDVVTLPEMYDFYLVSQSLRQGTVTPTCYNVISDNLDWGPNHIQRFTYKLTHLYFNCSATVSVPAPCQYAHKLAYLVAQNLRIEPHEKLNRTLYFL